MAGMTKAKLVAELDRTRERLADADVSIRRLTEENRAQRNRISVEMQSGAEWRGRALALREVLVYLAEKKEQWK